MVMNDVVIQLGKISASLSRLIVAGKLAQRPLVQLVQDIRQSVAFRATCGEIKTVVTSKRANEGVAVLSC